MVTAVRELPQVQRRDLWVPDELDQALRDWSPKTEMGLFVRKCAEQLPDRDMALELIDRFCRTTFLSSKLYLRAIYADGRVEDFGLVGEKKITTAGVGFLVDAWQGSVEMEAMRYHGIGTDATAESNAQTALLAELTTEYTGNQRAQGTLTEGASANIFKTVGTNLLDGTPGAALREHGILSQQATGGGVLWDRTVYSAITLSSGDTLESTYEATCSAEA